MVVIAVVVIIVFQNVQSVETTVLFWTARMPRVVLLLAVGGVGALVGYIAGVRRGKRQKPAK